MEGFPFVILVIGFVMPLKGNKVRKVGLFRNPRRISRPQGSPQYQHTIIIQTVDPWTILPGANKHQSLQASAIMNPKDVGMVKEALILNLDMPKVRVTYFPTDRQLMEPETWTWSHQIIDHAQTEEG